MLPNSLANMSDLKSDSTLLMIVMTICGILIVFLGLVLLIIIIGTFGKITEMLNSRASRPVKGKKSEAPAPDPIWSAPSIRTEDEAAVKQISANGIPDEIVAVIAAAVAAIGDGKSYAVRSVRKAPDGGRPAWNMAGIYENTRPF